MRQSGLGRIAVSAATAVVSLTLSSIAFAQPAPPLPVMPPSLPPAHVVNLMTNEGSAAFGAQWRVTDVKIVEVPAAINKERYKTTYQIEPRAMEPEFDDSKWEQVQAKDLGVRRSAGLTAFMWFRASLTVPARIGDFDLSKPAQAVFNVLVDDYGEVWVNGEMPRRSGYPSPATVQGLNMPNRVVLGTQVKAGDKFQLSVFAVNGPLSAPNGSIWFRHAMVEFYR
jgi:gluconolactonase